MPKKKLPTGNSVYKIFFPYNNRIDIFLDYTLFVYHVIILKMKLRKVTPLGRSFEAYWLMFDLNERDIGRKIIGVGDGPSSFNAEMKELSGNVTSIDPLYVLEKQEIEWSFYEVLDEVIDQLRANLDDWTWTYHQSPDHLRADRIAVIKKFIANYEKGKREKRYIAGQLPELDFKNASFDLALCSHFLFLYSEHYDYDFHRASIYEMLRVANDVRIFPLLDLTNKRSTHIDPLINELQADGYKVVIKKVGYEMQRGGNEMMRVFRNY